MINFEYWTQSVFLRYSAYYTRIWSCNKPICEKTTVILTGFLYSNKKVLHNKRTPEDNARGQELYDRKIPGIAE